MIAQHGLEPPRPLRPAPLGDRPPRRCRGARRRLFGRRRFDGAPPPRPRLGRAAGHSGRGAARRPRPARRGGARRRALLRGAGRAPRRAIRLPVRRRPRAEEEGRERRVRRAAPAVPRAPVRGGRDGGRPPHGPHTRRPGRDRPSPPRAQTRPRPRRHSRQPQRRRRAAPAPLFALRVARVPRRPGRPVARGRDERERRFRAQPGPPHGAAGHRAAHAGRDRAARARRGRLFAPPRRHRQTPREGDGRREDFFEGYLAEELLHAAHGRGGSTAAPPGRKQIEKVLLRLRRDPVFHESFAGQRLTATPRTVRLSPSKKKTTETS